MTDIVLDLLERWRGGDQAAARELFDRYAGRMIALARSRLSGKLASRIDPEDVVQSACRSFFAGAREGRYQLQRGDDLWQLLVATTLHKLHDQVRRHTARRRSVGAEQHFGSEDSLFGIQPAALAREPDVIEAVALIDEVEQLMDGLAPDQRRVLELRLQGQNLDEIAAATGRSLQTVRRLLDRVKERLRRALPGGKDSYH
jgi:RNA polymerase sigma-70 factor (ECF subfamily)